MKRLTKLLFICFSASFFFSSCATIVGGGSYFAHVFVPNHSEAMIYSQNRPQGKGTAVFKVRRKDANKFTLVVKEDGCENQEFKFRKRTFRGWALVGSLVTFTLWPDGGIPLPVGVAVDLINGAYWKPNLFEPGVSKQDNKHYNYTLNYNGCQKRDEEEKKVLTKPKETETPKETTKSKVERLREMKKLLDEGILTQEEFDKEKAKILEE